MPKLTEVERLKLALLKAEAESLRACEARANCGPWNSTRSSQTTAEAKWARAAENRDRLIARLDKFGVDGWAVIRAHKDAVK